MEAKNRNTRVALGLFVFSFVLFLIAFVSPYWLVTDGKIQNPRFTNLGLWEVCFRNFQDIHRFYDNRFNGCMWVFEEEYYIIHDFLLPGFYVAVQLLSTLCFVMSFIAIPLMIAFVRTSRDDDRYVFLLLTIGSCLTFASIFGFLAVLVFGLYGDSRDWMPGWQNNDMGWAFALGVVGAVMFLPSGILFMVEARRERYKRLNEIVNREVSEFEGDIYQQDEPYLVPSTSRPRRPPSTQEVTQHKSGIQTDI